MLDTVAFCAVWALAGSLILEVLAVVSPDNPWGSLAFAIAFGFVGAAVGLALVEAKCGHTLGRQFTGLVVVGADANPLSGRRVVLRALIKLGVLGLVAHVAADLDGAGALFVLFGYALVNAAVCALRSDGRGLIDLLAGTQSTVPQAVGGAPL